MNKEDNFIDLSLFRSKEIAANLREKIWKLAEETPQDKINIMHVCGTHEHTITYFGIRRILPHKVNLIAGPGCPVCVVPAHEIDKAIELALEGIKVYTFGDMFRVPGTKQSLANAKAEGGNVEVVYGFLDAIRNYLENDLREAVFFGVGFETTAPSFASQIVRRRVPKGLTILPSFRITVPVVKYALKVHNYDLQGIIAPGHVSTITGAKAWSFISEEFNVPVVVAGFEPIDVLLGVYFILKSIIENKPKIYNEYGRVVRWEGNIIAQRYIQEVFETIDGAWRGIGIIPQSAWVLNKKYGEIDARNKYGIEIIPDEKMPTGCICADVILGLAKPTDCKLFKRYCTPSNPIGPCMVSSEGTCSIWYKYGGHEIIQKS